MRNGRMYFEITKEIAIINDALNRWVNKHSEWGETPLYDRDGRKLTKVEVDRFIWSQISRWEREILRDPSRRSVTTECVFSKTEDGRIVRKKIKFPIIREVDPSYEKYIGGGAFHGTFFNL